MQKNFRVVFFKSFPSQAQAAGTIAIWPSDPKWNDFGYQFRARARIYTADQSEPSNDAAVTFTSVSLFVVPWPLAQQTRFDTWINERAGKRDSMDASEVHNGFYCILANPKSYQTLLNITGREADQVASLFDPLRDICYFRWRKLETESLKSLLRLRSIGSSLFRNEGPYQAWHQTRLIFGFEASDNIDDARKKFTFSSLLPGFIQPHSLSVNFDVAPPLIDRVHALIGRNGVGKSQMLRELVIEAGLRVSGDRSSPFSKDEGLRGENTSIVSEGLFANRIIVLAWDINNDFPRESRLDSTFQYFYFLMNEPRVESSETDWMDLQSSETQTAMLLQLLRGDDRRQNYERLQRVLAPAFKVGRLAVLIEGDGEANSVWESLGSIMASGEGAQLGKLQRVDLHVPPLRIDDSDNHVPLSSGERSFLNFGIRCTARVTEGTLLILDEPETHLHPNLIADFMRILSVLLEETKSIALIATHSPFVVREIPGRCVHVLHLDDERKPTIQHAYLRTLGASVDRLAVDIFGDADSPQLNRDLAISISKTHKSIESVREVYGKDLSMEMLSEIRELIEFPSGDSSQNA